MSVLWLGRGRIGQFIRVAQAIKLLLTGDARAEGVETDVDVLVTTIDLVDVADHAGSLCRHGCNEEGDTGTDVWRSHVA